MKIRLIPISYVAFERHRDCIYLPPPREKKNLITMQLDISLTNCHLRVTYSLDHRVLMSAPRPTSDFQPPYKMRSKRGGKWGPLRKPAGLANGTNDLLAYRPADRILRILSFFFATSCVYLFTMDRPCAGLCHLQREYMTSARFAHPR
jgi:hypothetical protein